MDQGLPVAFENTAGTWQNMPGMAAFYTGLQNQSAQDNIRMLQEAFAREQAFKEKSRPIELNNLMSAGELQKAQALHNLAQARGLNVDASGKEQTLESDVAARKSKNAATQVEDTAKSLDAQGKMYLSLSTMAKDPNIPNWEKVKRVMESLKINDPDGTISSGMLARVNQLPQILSAQADHYFQNSEAAKLQSIKEAGDTARNTATNQANIQIGAGHDAAARYGADARIKSAEAKNGAVSFEQTFGKLKKASEKIAALADQANKVEETDPAYAASLRARANDPTLRGLAAAELSAAGGATVSQEPGKPAQLTPRGSQVDIPQAGGAKPQAPTADPLEGRTATNDKGQKIIRKNGQWIPLQ